MHSLPTGYPQVVPAIHRLSTTPAQLSTGCSHVDNFGLSCGEAVDNSAQGSGQAVSKL